MSHDIYIKKEIGDAPFTRCPNALFHDSRLGATAMGIIGHLLSKPSTWKTCLEVVSAETGTPLRDVKSAMNRGIDAGYVIRVAKKGDGGRLSGFDYLVSGSPLGEDERKTLLAGRTPWTNTSHRAPLPPSPPFSVPSVDRAHGKTTPIKKEEETKKEEVERPIAKNRALPAPRKVTLPPSKKPPSPKAIPEAKPTSAADKAVPPAVVCATSKVDATQPAESVESHEIATPGPQIAPTSAESDSGATEIPPSTTAPQKAGISKAKVVDAWLNPAAATGADPGVKNVTANSKLAKAVQQWNAMALEAGICPLDGQLENSAKAGLCMWLEEIGSDYAAILAYLNTADGRKYAAARPSLSMVSLSRSGEWSRTLRHAAKVALGLVRPAAPPKTVTPPPRPIPDRQLQPHEMPREQKLAYYEARRAQYAPKHRKPDAAEAPAPAVESEPVNVDWNRALESWVQTGAWNPALGASPDAIGSKVPDSAMIRFLTTTELPNDLLLKTCNRYLKRMWGGVTGLMSLRQSGYHRYLDLSTLPAGWDYAKIVSALQKSFIEVQQSDPSVMWVSRVLDLKTGRGAWREEWGPAPGQPGCTVDAEDIERAERLIEEFGDKAEQERDREETELIVKNAMQGTLADAHIRLRPRPSNSQHH